MTTIYKPVLIESAEQAEALPVGTIAIGTRYGVLEKGVRGRWWAGLADLSDRIVVNGTALVPIEAEEEMREHPHRVEERVGHVYRQPIQQVRYKTRWEAV